MKIANSLWAALVCAGLSTTSLAAVPLSVELNPVTTASASDAVVRWSITNSGKSAVQVLRWETPLDGVSRSLFEVSHAGKSVAYAEKLVHWGHPEAEDFVTIEAGQTLSKDVNLADYYRMTEGGAYSVFFDGDLTYVREGDASKAAGHFEELGQMSLSADPVVVSSAGRSDAFYNGLPSRNAPLNFSASKALGYSGCTAARQSTVLTAHNSAKTYATNALNYLNAGTTGARYTTWFGSYVASRYTTVKSHFNKINNVLQNLTTTYDCACAPANASAYAYVYPGSPYRIYLCNAFWAAPNTGTDSRAGTIIHEQSHFTVNGGTQDNAYGQTAAKNLARTNPAKAVANADNHEYFSENTPFQN